MKKEDKKLKMAVISGAAHALKYKEDNPRASEQEVIQQLTIQLREILEKIDKEI